MRDDCYEARVRYWVNVPRVTHKVMIDGQCIGRVYDNGAIEIDEPAREGCTPEHQHPLMTDA